MFGFDVIASTVRAGLAIDEVEFEVAETPPVTGYLLGARLEGPQPVVIALHDERGDKASLLPDLRHLVGRGFIGLSINSPGVRRAIADRDHLAAFEQQFKAVLTALHLVQGDPGVNEHRIALVGRGLGGEVAAAIATHTFAPRVVAVIDALPRRADFLQQSTHPLAAGFRLFHDPAEVERQVLGLEPHRLSAQLGRATDTHWFVQIGEDDDRLDAEDHDLIRLGIPPTVRVDRHRHRADLGTNTALRSRVDFVSGLCG